jgi:4-oxalocrotonate tautomerase family enzyme
MPTYTVSAVGGRLSDQQKSSLAAAVTDIHCRLTGAPKYFVQVIFVDVPSNNYFVAGKRLEHDNIFVHGQIRAGRPLALKHQLIEALMETTAQVAETDTASIQIYIVDVPGDQIAEWGRVLPLPGEEASWEAAIPDNVRQRMNLLL